MYDDNHRDEPENEPGAHWASFLPPPSHYDHHVDTFYNRVLQTVEEDCPF